MRFEDVMHPEMIFGIRGDQRLIDFYKNLRSKLYVEDGKIFLGTNLANQTERLLIEDEIFRKHYLLTQHFKQASGSVYYIKRELIEALSSVDKEVPLEVIPPEFSGYILFEKNTVFDEEGSIEGGYVSITKGIKSGISDEFAESPIFWASYVPDNFLKKGVGISALLCELKKEKISKILSKTPNADIRLFSKITPTKEIEEKRNRIWRLLLNTIIFINSKDPKIEKAPPIRSLGISKNEARRRKLTINETKLPVLILDKHFKIERNFSCDSTVVRAHFRFQRVGKGLRDVKLVLVREHERVYSNE